MSNDPQFIDKVRDVVGLYLNPPDHAVVLCVDEKTGIQALDRTRPSLPMRPGQVERRTHDYVRHGVIDLFAALNVATGEVLHQTRRRHTAEDVLAFFKWIDLHVPRDLEVHVVLDNLSAHKGPKIRAWAAVRDGDATAEASTRAEMLKAQALSDAVRLEARAVVILDMQRLRQRSR